VTLQFLEQLGIIATAITAFIGFIYIFFSKVKKPFKKTVSPEEILHYIDDLNKKMEAFNKDITKKFDNEKKHASDTHLRIFKKLEELSIGLSFIKGSLKNHSSSSKSNHN